MNHDGKVVISTALDNSGLEKGISGVSGQLGGLKNAVKETGNAINSAISEGFSKSTLLAQTRVNELQKQFDAASRSLGEALESDDNAAAERYGAQQIRIYDKLESARERLLISVQSDARKQAEAEERAAEKARRAAEKTRKEIAGSVAPAKLLRKETLGLSKGFNGAQKAVKRFGSRLVSIAASALVFNTISAGLREMTSYISTALKTNNQFSSELAMLKGALLTAFQPIYNFVLPALTALVRGLRLAVGYIAKLFASLSGSTLESSAKAAEQLQKETEAMDSLGGSAKKAQKSLAGFDQIQKLGENQNTSYSKGDSVNFDFTWDSGQVSREAQLFADELTANLKEKDWFGTGQTLGEGLMRGIESVDWHSVGSVIGDVIGGAFAIALGFMLSIDPETIRASVLSFTSGLFDSFSQTIQTIDWVSVGKQILDLLLFALSSLNPMTSILSIMLTPEGKELTKSTSELVGSIVGGLAAAIVGMGERIGEIASDLWTSFKGYFDDYVDWEGTPGEIINGLWEGIKNAIKGAGDWIYNNIWIPFRDGFKKAFDIHPPSHKMEEFGGNIIDGLYEGITGAISKVKKACEDVWKAIKEKFAGVGDWFEEKFSGAWEKVKEVFSNGSKTFEGIKEGISTTFKEIVNKLIDGINKIISTPFNKINSMLNTIRSIDVLGVTPFKGLWNYNPLSVPQIPKLAQGAVLPPNKPFMAIVGDQRHGTNIEAPLSTIQEAVAVVMQDQVSAMMAGFNALLEENRMLRSVVEGIEVGDTVIGEAASRYNQKMAIVRGG